MLAALAVVAAWPLGRTLYFALTDATLADPDDHVLVGLANFLSVEDGVRYGLLADPLWWTAVANTVTFAVVSVALETVLGVVLALAMHAALPGRALLRAAVLVPWAIPTVVSAQLWAWLLHDRFGVVNALALRLGLLDAPIAWTAEPDLALLSVILVDVWKTTPFVALLVLAALQMLPRECYEAARVDGIGPLRLFFGVTLPLIRPALTVAVTFRLLDAFRVFDVVYVMSGGAAATMTMSVYARQQLVDFQDVGYGSAAASLLFLTVAVLTALWLTAARANVLAGARP